MANVVIQVTKDKLEEITAYYQNSIIKKPANTLFLAKVNGTTINAYRSGKVMFQGQNAAREANKWSESGAVTSGSANKSSVNDHGYKPPTSLFKNAHIGSDEAGTGDYFGPITVSAVYVPDEKITILKQMGITDSKTLTDDKIAILAKELVKEKIPYTLLTLDNTKYNKLQKKGWNQGKMKAMLHHHAIEKLLVKIGAAPLHGILIDQFCQPLSYRKHISSEGAKLQENVFFMTKAESYSTSVAAASIIARAKFVKEMDLLSERLGVTIPKGASSKVDETAAYLIKKHGLDVLYDNAKIHFANTDKAMNYVR